MNLLKKIFNALFSTSAAGLYVLLFAIAIGVATFIENDFGTSSAQKVIFKTHWFELLLTLFGISLIVNIFKFRMLQQPDFPCRHGYHFDRRRGNPIFWQRRYDGYPGGQRF
jgi:hypothetical protein